METDFFFSPRCWNDRLYGVAVLGPVGNYWWPGLPSNVSREAWYQQLPRDQWAVWVSHHLPWLTYWWNTQSFFPGSSVIAYNPALLSEEDAMLMDKFGMRPYMVTTNNKQTPRINKLIAAES